MVKLIITSQLLFNIEDSRITEYESYTVPDDYLNSPLLLSRCKDGLIYLENSMEDEKISPYILILENDFTFEQMIYTADYYQMYDVKSFIDKFLTKVPTKYSSCIDDIIDNIPEKIISRILKVEDENFWKKQIFHRGKMGEFNFVNISINDDHIKSFPTHPMCFYKNPLLAWKNVNLKLDIKKLLYLTVEMDLNVNEEIIEESTRFSNRGCYPYDDDIVKECTWGEGIYKVSTSTFDKIIDPLHQMILNCDGVIHNSSYLIETLLHKDVKYSFKNISVSNIENMLNKMCNKILITYTDDKNVYDVHCKVSGVYVTFSLHKYNGNKDYFDIEIFKQDGKIKINTNGEFLIFACTNILPMSIDDYVKKDIHDDNINIGLSKSEFEKLHGKTFDEEIPYVRGESNGELYRNFASYYDKLRNVGVPMFNILYPCDERFKYNKFKFICLSKVFTTSYVYMIHASEKCVNSDEFNFKDKLENLPMIEISESTKSYIKAVHKEDKMLEYATGEMISFDEIYSP